MHMIDFEYDGNFLSDFGFIVCYFDYSSGVNVVNPGSQITFNKVTLRKGRRYNLADTQYDECIAATFDICKNPDIYQGRDAIISVDEYRDMVRWLNRHQFLKFRNAIEYCDDIPEVTTCYYNASFNVEKLEIAGDLVGLRLNMETDSPFGYGEQIVETLKFTSGHLSQSFMDVSDDVGSMYPDMIITCGEAGNLTLVNSMESGTMALYNLTLNEVITIQGEPHIISSSLSTHNICNDFNYRFLKIGNKYNDRVNTITASKPCEVKIIYNPVIKDTI